MIKVKCQFNVSIAYSENNSGYENTSVSVKSISRYLFTVYPQKVILLVTKCEWPLEKPKKD